MDLHVFVPRRRRRRQRQPVAGLLCATTTTTTTTLAVVLLVVQAAAAAAAAAGWLQHFPTSTAATATGYRSHHCRGKRPEQSTTTRRRAATDGAFSGMTPPPFRSKARRVAAGASTSSNARSTIRCPLPALRMAKSSSSSSGGGGGGGDPSKGAALLVENLSVRMGAFEILNDVNWRVEPGTKWALIGENGAGKSTLLKAVAGEIPHDEGKIAILKKRRNGGGSGSNVGYLRQTAVAGSTKTVYDEACSGMVEIEEARKAMDDAAEREDLDALERATSRFESLGGYKQEEKVYSVLRGLGFSQEDVRTKRCDELSGGWQMRVSFARLLLSEPSLCLMDEPGNHLDAAAKRWLAKYLADYQGEGSMVLVTHDVELLKSMDHIAEIVPSAKSLQLYKSCTYDKYLELKEQRAAAAYAEYERNTEKAAKLQAFVDKWGASATKASAAQSRAKQLRKMQEQGLLDEPALAVVAKRFRPSLSLPDPPRAVGEVLLSLKSGAQVGYVEGKPLVSDIDLDVVRGMRLLIRGPNGAGKSTILHALRGTLPLLQGDRVENPSLRLGMFTQDLAQELDQDARAVDVATAYARAGLDGDVTVSDEDARNAMGRLGLRGEKSLRRIRDLSGGEKARVALAMFSLKPSNLYLFDEVSNHLDTECVEALSTALSSWGRDAAGGGVDDGAFVVVSHDRNFCDKIDFTHVATVRDGTFKLEQRGAVPGDWVVGDLKSPTPSSERQQQRSDSASATSTPEPSPAMDDKTRKRAYNAPRRIAKLEETIERLEERIAAVDEKMLLHGSDVGKLVELSKEKEKLESEVSDCMEEWEELEQLASQAGVVVG